MQTQNIMLALLGGVLPTLLWLWFWRKEDRLHPEPKRLILLAFIAGGIAVGFAIPLQQLAREMLGSAMTPPLIIAWAGIEEGLKYVLVAAAVLWRKAVDEPVDILIYMLTAALGFSAIENSLFLLTPLAHDTLATTIITGNFRFFGATLLHLLSSSIIGISLAFAFHKSSLKRIKYALFGVILATALHTLFNLFILNASGAGIIKVFAFVWVGIVILLLFFEKVKQMQILPTK